jgi:hypothetical protein
VPSSRVPVADAVERFRLGIGVELRAFVRDAGRRRALPYTAYVGVPGSVRTPLLHDASHDQVLRADLVERAVDGLSQQVVDGSGACVWVTRPGDLALDTRDLGWLAVARTGFERHDLALPAFFVLDRNGWHEVLSGRTRRWNRVRPHRVDL